MPTYNCRNVPEQSCANDEVITQNSSAIVDNYILIEQLAFQSAAAHWPASLGRAGMKIATLQTGRHHLVLISVEPANLCFVCDACENWWVCGQAWRCPLSKQHPILLAMVGPDGSIHMAEYQSLSQRNVTHFEVPGIYYSMIVGHACGAEPLIVQIIILIRILILGMQRWLVYFVQRSGEIRVCFPILFHCALDSIVRHF
jgi:hypothetical protein